MNGWAGIVRLSAEDRQVAETCARVRVEDAVGLGANDRFGLNSYEAHYWGALGEMAFAAYLGVPWRCASRAWAQPDVAGYEVRSIPPTTKWVYAKAKPNDPADRKVALVLHLSHGTAALIVGWITVADIRLRGERVDRPEAFMLSDLRWLDRDFPERAA